MKTVVTKGGPVSNRKGISVPTRVVKTAFPTQKDLISIQTAIQLKIETLMLSFVQCQEDVLAVRQITKDKLHLMSKIETPAAFANLQ